jgi:hypothetical protein
MTFVEDAYELQIEDVIHEINDCLNEIVTIKRVHPHMLYTVHFNAELMRERAMNEVTKRYATT